MLVDVFAVTDYVFIVPSDDQLWIGVDHVHHCLDWLVVDVQREDVARYFVFFIQFIHQTGWFIWSELHDSIVASICCRMECRIDYCKEWKWRWEIIVDVYDVSCVIPFHDASLLVLKVAYFRCCCGCIKAGIIWWTNVLFVFAEVFYLALLWSQPELVTA